MRQDGKKDGGVVFLAVRAVGRSTHLSRPLPTAREEELMSSDDV